MGRSLLGITLLERAAVGVAACAQKAPVNLDAFDLRYQYRGAPGGGTSTGGSQTGTVTNSSKDICRSLRE
jgi:hypothetical protein